MGPEIQVKDAEKELKGLVSNAEKAVMTEDQKAAEATKQQEAQKKAKEAADQKAKDDAVLAKKEEERSEEEKARAVVLADEKAKADKEAEEKKKADEEAKLTADEKIQRVKEKSQERIDGILNELKQLKDQGSVEAKELREALEKVQHDNAELLKNRDTTPADDTVAIVDDLEQKRLAKYLAEDKDKPLAQRREMSDADLDAWLTDETVAAQRWIAKQTRRAEREREADVIAERKKVLVTSFVENQNASLERVRKQYPELDVAARTKQLLAEGKKGPEIKDLLAQENEHYRVLQEVMTETGSEKYLSDENGPERAAEEMNRRLKHTTNASEDQTKIDTLTKQVEDLQAEMAHIKEADEGIGGSHPRPRSNGGKLTENEQILVDTMKSAKAPQASIDEALEQYRRTRGKA